jgi:hypothetical protein
MGKRKSYRDSSEGEGFDFDDNDDFSEDSSGVEVVEEDTWQPIVLGKKAHRSEYDKASKSDFWIAKSSDNCS